MDKINELIDQATDALAYETPLLAAEALEELAYICARGGKEGQKMFLELRRLVITGAEHKTSKLFVKEKLISAEKEMREKRNGKKIIIKQ